MKPFIFILVVLCCPIFAFCQDITGLWKGSMLNDSTKQSLEYEIVITKEKGKYSAFSYTWFLINDSKYYGIKKLTVRVAKDGKIVLQDAKLVENNYPVTPLKNVLQLNVLDLVNNGAETMLNGIFVTNSSKDYKGLTGSISVRKVNLLSQSYLMQYLNRNGENNLTMLK